MKTAKTYYSLLIIILYFFSSNIIYASADKSIGTIVEIKGKAFITTNKKVKTIKKNSKIYEKDFIRTSKKSFVRVLMNDDSVIKLSQNSNLKFDEFQMTNVNDRKATYNLELGKVRALINKKLKKGHINLKTKALTLGVRGTEFLVNSYLSKKGYESDIAVIEGLVQIDIVDDKGVPIKGMSTLMNPGQFITSSKVKEVGVEKAIQVIPKEVMKELKEDSHSFLEENNPVIESSSVQSEALFDSGDIVDDSQESSEQGDTNPIEEVNSQVSDNDFETVEEGLNEIDDDFVEQTIITAEEEVEDILDSTEDAVDITSPDPVVDTPIAGGGGGDDPISGGIDDGVDPTEEAIKKAEREAEREARRIEQSAAKVERETQRAVQQTQRESARVEKEAERAQDKIDREEERAQRKEEQQAIKGQGKGKNK